MHFTELGRLDKVNYSLGQNKSQSIENASSVPARQDEKVFAPFAKSFTSLTRSVTYSTLYARVKRSCGSPDSSNGVCLIKSLDLTKPTFPCANCMDVS